MRMNDNLSPSTLQLLCTPSYRPALLLRAIFHYCVKLPSTNRQLGPMRAAAQTLLPPPPSTHATSQLGFLHLLLSLHAADDHLTTDWHS